MDPRVSLRTPHRVPSPWASSTAAAGDDHGTPLGYRCPSCTSRSVPERRHDGGRAGDRRSRPAPTSVSRLLSRWRSPPAGAASAATRGQCGDAARVPARAVRHGGRPRPTWRSGAPARAGRTRASTPWRCCCCGCAARCPPRGAAPGVASWIADGAVEPGGDRPLQQRAGERGRRSTPRVPTPGATAPRSPTPAAVRPPPHDLDPTRARRAHRPHVGRARRARPVARRPAAHRARRPRARPLRDVGRPRRPARRRPGRRPRQPGPPPRRRGRRPARLARARARRARRPAPPGPGRPARPRAAAGGSPTRSPSRCGWQVRQADVLAGVPDTDTGSVDGPQRHPRGPHRGPPHVAARRSVGPVGDGAVVRRVPPVARRVARRRHDGPRRPVPLSRRRSWRALVGARERRRAPTPACRRAGHGDVARRLRTPGRHGAFAAEPWLDRMPGDAAWPPRRRPAGAGCSPTTPARCRSRRRARASATAARLQRRAARSSLTVRVDVGRLRPAHRPPRRPGRRHRSRRRHLVRRRRLARCSPRAAMQPDAGHRRRPDRALARDGHGRRCSAPTGASRRRHAAGLARRPRRRRAARPRRRNGCSSRSRRATGSAAPACARPPAAPLLTATEPDDSSAGAAGTARRGGGSSPTWPVLEDEWLLARRSAAATGCAPELLVAAARPAPHRRHPAGPRAARRRRPLAAWLIEHQPRLRPRPGSGPSPEAIGDAARPADRCRSCWPCSRRRPAGGATRGRRPPRRARSASAHRAVLVNFVARVRPDALPALAPGARPRRPPVARHRSRVLARRSRPAAPPHAHRTGARMTPPAANGRYDADRAATRDVLRPHAEHEYADELAALAAADDRPRPPNWRLSPWAVVTYLLGGAAARRHRDHPEVRRPAPPDRDRRRHARHRPGAAAARRARHRQDVGQRAPRRRDQRRLDAARAGHRRHDRGDVALRLELRPPARRGPERGRARARARSTGRCRPARSSASRS